MKLLIVKLRAPLWAAIAMILVACGNEKMPITDYQQARSIFWQSLYPFSGETLYCQQAFGGDDHRGINIEHVFPMSWVKSALNCGTRKQCRVVSQHFNLIEADLHNLYPARSDVNQQRSSFPFGEISGEARHFGPRCDFEVDKRSGIAEPAPEVRGEVARAMFYMADRYKDQGLMIYRKQGKMLQQWHNSDPPSDHERSRNNQIEQIQGNRNPFIDEPQALNSLIGSGHFF